MGALGVKTVQIGVLVQDTGEKPRTLQHWSDLGILKPESDTDKQGRGNFRMYRAEPLGGERTWALLASAYAKLRLPLGDIRRLIYAERLMHDPIELIDKNDPHLERVMRIREDRKTLPAGFVEPFEAAIAGEPNILAVVALRPHDPVTPIRALHLRHVKRERAKFAVDEHVVLDDFEEDAAIENYRNLSEDDRADLKRMLSARRTQERALRRLMADNPSATILNLSKIFEPLRRELGEQVLRGQGSEQQVGTTRDDQDKA